jgi:spore germination protein YaaH
MYDDDGVRHIEEYGELLGDVILEWAETSRDGFTVKERDEQRWKRAREAAADHDLTVYGLLANLHEGSFDRDSVAQFLESPEKMEAHAQELVDAALADDLDGIDVDYEHLHAEDRDAYSEFMEKLAEACHEADLLLSTAVHSKTAEPGTWDGDRAQDWERLGAAVDVFRVMTYDYSWLTSPPGPVAPPDWVEEVIAFAVTQVPAEKIEIGIPQYGYLWGPNGPASFIWPQFLENYPDAGEGVRDEASQELKFEFEENTVFFADAEAQAPKFRLAREKGVRGVALWHLGAAQPRLFEVQREN